MARTTSAGQGEDFARAVRAPVRVLLRRVTTIANTAATDRLLALGALAAVHASTLAVVGPRIDGDHALVALMLIASLVVSGVILLVGLGQRHPAKCGSLAPTAEPLGCASPPGPPTDEPAPAADPAASAAAGHPLSRSTHNELMARVSHELRTPLNAVVGFSDLMGHELFGPLGHPRYEEYVGYIRESGRKLLKSAEDTIAITSLLTASEGMPFHEEVTLAVIAREARQIATVDAPERAARMGLDIDPEIVVLAHRRALKQVLVNLLAEAMTRAGCGSDVAITASASGDKVLLRVGVPQSGASSRDVHASLPICLARTLVELSGSRLVESCDQNGGWQVSTLLERAVQRDFFLPSRRDVLASAYHN